MKIWTVTSGNPGMESQVRGLAQAWGGEVTSKKAERRLPWSLLPLTWHGGAFWQLTPESDTFEPPYPDVLITCGRRSIPFSLALHKKSSGRVFRVHIQDPRISTLCFHRVVAPQHDGLTGINVLQSVGAIHHLTKENLEKERLQWEARLSPYPRPWTVVLIGGDTNRYSFTQKTASYFLEVLEQLAQKEGGIFVMSCKRTPLFLKEKLQRWCQKREQTLFYSGEGPNPYMACLALADHIVVTNDSANMMSEACFTGKPVWILELPQHKKTPPWRCGQTLIEKGLARPFKWPLKPWCYTPLDEVQRLIVPLKKAFHLFQSGSPCP